ncbi:Rrf2 family nitric oxide-sensitive transcriptional repressor [Rhizomicrobium palustre]|uniref:Rrf2 family nitric oxide-sensitive transcriptional repressor n=1 Tax=Rhizomicrobium palustre TaxID=189966 RepID=A0A846N0R3_9PROT|nr:Rrf2 family nitric oxide-sensitive transcriptional repressor [Rhizomicrobium palustre]
MKLLASTDFAVRLLMLLAHRGGEGPLSVEMLSRELGGLSRHHLHKIVQNLASMGLVETLRGAGGGVLLAKKPEDIRIGSLLAALEEDCALVECFREDGACTLMPVCRLKGFLGTARRNFYRELDQRTIADCLPLKK